MQLWLRDLLSILHKLIFVLGILSINNIKFKSVILTTESDPFAMWLHLNTKGLLRKIIHLGRSEYQQHHVQNKQAPKQMSHVKLNITCLWLGHTWKTQAISQSSPWKPLQSMTYIFSCGHCANTERGECRYCRGDCNNRCVHMMPTRAKIVLNTLHLLKHLGVL